MRFLLDTNVFLKWTDGQTLPRPAERAIARSGNEFLVSIVTAWEIVMKRQLNRSAADVELAIQSVNATLLAVRFNHLDELSRLPLHDHRDPFDRMLIAQALAEDVPIISADRRFSEYKKLRVIWD